ncbi:MAG: hypothetical protein IH905_10185 [Proteobacteria bacterium]|nr:hypothetical protein [Pseudomonadota bacterium]
MLKKLLAILKRLGIRPAIVQDYLGGFPTRPGQQPKQGLYSYSRDSPRGLT